MTIHFYFFSLFLPEYLYYQLNFSDINNEQVNHG